MKVKLNLHTEHRMVVSKSQRFRHPFNLPKDCLLPTHPLFLEGNSNTRVTGRGVYAAPPTCQAGSRHWGSSGGVKVTALMELTNGRGNRQKSGAGTCCKEKCDKGLGSNPRGGFEIEGNPEWGFRVIKRRLSKG